MKVGEIWTKHYLLLQDEINNFHKYAKEHPENKKICDELIDVTKKSRCKILSIDKKSDALSVQLLYIDPKTLKDSSTSKCVLTYERNRFLMLWEKDWSFSEDW